MHPLPLYTITAHILTALPLFNLQLVFKNVPPLNTVVFNFSRGSETEFRGTLPSNGYTARAAVGGGRRECSDKTLPSCHLFQHKSQAGYYEPENEPPGKDTEDKQPDLLHSPLNISSRPISSGTIRKLIQSY
jgi:hypothetical protein